ncbi:MAG: hypothetical protein IT306_01595 [Chloroflexi bacterium]|nr:hypothetical protein [Chloroflexota bacterium]
MDPLETVFVFCFVFGVAMSVISLAFGVFHGGALGDGNHGGLHLGDAGGGHDAGGAGQGGNGQDVSPLNLQTITAFLAFFGGSGWVLYGSAGLGAALALIVATVVGFGGGAVVFLFLVKVLLAGQRFMDPAESRMEGTVAQVTMAIHAGGTGEIGFSRDGARRSEGARSVDGQPIEVGTEVVIVRYERGLAYVEPWASYAGED